MQTVLILLGCLIGLVVLAAGVFLAWVMHQPEREQFRVPGTPPPPPAPPTRSERRAAAMDAQRAAQARIVCQFCSEAGHVTTRMVQRKKGISGGKATGALLTGGVSLVAVGLSRKGWVTILTCGNCRMTWEAAA